VRELNGPASQHPRGPRCAQTVLTDVTRRGRRKQRWQLAAAIAACFALISAGIAFGMRTLTSEASVHPVGPAAPEAAQRPLDLTTGAAESAAREGGGVE
jgi:hypothetical protein